MALRVAVIVLSLLVVLVVGLNQSGWVTQPNILAQTKTESTPRTISVSGNAEIKVAPDEIIVTLGVETSHNDLETAKKENDTIMQRLLKTAQEHGIEAKHIQTDYLNIEPRYHDNYEKREFIGFFVRKTMVLTLKDMSKFENLLTAFLKGGSNYVQGIEFKTTELRRHKDAARALAIKAAKEKAVAMAAELGQKIGKPLTIREEQSDWYSWYSGWWGYGRGGMASQNVVQNTGSSNTLDPDSTIAPGQISVNARVAVEFELQE